MELLIGISREARLRVIELGKNWKHFLLLGCTLLLGGVLALIIPLVTSFSPEQVVGWTFLICGFFQLFQALRVQGTESFRWWLVFGVFLVFIAVAVLQNPLQNISTLHLVALLLTGLGLLKILYARRLRPAYEWTRLIISGLISLVLATIFLTPLFSLSTKLGFILAAELINSGLWLSSIGWSFNTMNERLIKQVI